MWFFLNRFLVCFNLFVLLFLETPCTEVAVQLSMEYSHMRHSFLTYKYSRSLQSWILPWRNISKAYNWFYLKVKTSTFPYHKVFSVSMSYIQRHPVSKMRLPETTRFAISDLALKLFCGALWEYAIPKSTLLS